MHYTLTIPPVSVVLVHIDTKSSDAIVIKFAKIWQVQYPKLVQVFHDNDGKFMGYSCVSILLVLGTMQMHVPGNDYDVKDTTTIMTTSNTTGCLASC